MSALISRSTEETASFGRAFAHKLRPGDVVGLHGTLGSGKTCFVGGVCQGLGVAAHVSSPTFTLINEYPAPFGLVAHIDLYRIRDRAELPELGIEEYLNERCICLIEWAETVADLLPADSIHVTFSFLEAEQERRIVIDEPAGLPA
ncbi:MAG TPA: tRNA (adenosine(37)-N6)-threonylcarbamoyltransferase complex ATPase subunit type 1 TsaE [Bacteroidota bacterium]|nr:tRNA (adenosine(37)-N6)-threonylcarbamoyltransferase complex ATPase subunit type 1 TsaE [Bacteroidota bacterium]